MSDSLETAVSPIPQDLQEKVSALRAIATTHHLLINGSYKHADLTLVNASVAFLKALHEQMAADALAHPSADLVPQLQALKSEEN